jgi:hypothetical protein
MSDPSIGIGRGRARGDVYDRKLGEYVMNNFILFLL